MILIACMSCHRHADRRQAVRDTWWPEAMAHPAIGAFFFLGGPRPPDPPLDEIFLDVGDTKPDQIAKVQAMFRFALAISTWHRLVKCDDDTYLRPERLVSECQQEQVPLLGGPLTMARARYGRNLHTSGGGGYGLTRDCVKLLAEAGPVEGVKVEDAWVDAVLASHGIEYRADRRFCQTAVEGQPQADNDIITAHPCNGDRMRAIHRAFL